MLQLFCFIRQIPETLKGKNSALVDGLMDCINDIIDLFVFCFRLTGDKKMAEQLLLLIFTSVPVAQRSDCRYGTTFAFSALR